jgi:glyoxylase-like metal-dependent hydrolase (beta-lactamase superfamily II)
LVATVRRIDCMHLGRDRVIAAHERRGAIIDPGPESCLEALLAGLHGEPQALLLTHIHLDHAGAAGALVRRYPSLRVFVHENGAPHLVDPSRLLTSARRLYGRRMEELWGEVVPVPEANVTALCGGEVAEGLRVEHTPGHASHHVCFLDESSGDAYVGDVAGVRIPPCELIVPPTPPPEIDPQAWARSLDTVAAWRPERLHLTHFGSVTEVEEHLAAMQLRLRERAELARRGERDFMDAIERELDEAASPAEAERYRQAAPSEQLWLGLERYWRKRAEAEE